MGLFDGYNFNSQPSGSQSGGLLDILRFFQPRHGAGQPQSDPAAIQPDQEAVVSQPGFGERALAGFQGFAKGPGLLPAIAGAASGFSTGSTENQTLKVLVSNGLDPELAKIVIKDPALMRVVLPQIMGIGGKTDDIKEFEYAKKSGFTGSLNDWLQRKRAGAGEYSLTPVYGTNENGETVLVQPGKSGEAIQTKLPPGVKISSGVEKLDLGPQWGIIDKRTGQIVGYQQKDIVGKAEAEAVGKGQGEAKLILPQTATAVDSALRVIGELRTHPGIDVGTGLSSVIDPRSLVPGSNGYDFNQANEQAKGKAFMVAREALKGAGQVTDFEGMKGEQAIANLKTSQSKGQYLKALDELERMLKLSYENLQKKAGVSSMPTATAAPGADLRKKYGLE